MLGQCAALARLDISGNEVGDAGARSFVGVLGQCPALTHIDLSYSQQSQIGLCH